MKTIKIILCLLAAILLAGCRSSRPTAVYEVSADSLSISVDTFFRVSKDSFYVSTELRNRINDAVEFVDGGGCVSVSSDGSLIMSGVANVKSSRLNSSVSRAESQSLELQYQSKDSIAETHCGTTFSESRPNGGAAKCSVKSIVGIAVILIFLVMIFIARFKDSI